MKFKFDSIKTQIRFILLNHLPCRIVSLPGKGEGLLATRDIAAGTLIVDEAPIVVLDPPTKRRDLLMLLGCRLFSTIDMRTTPDNIRSEFR